MNWLDIRRLQQRGRLSPGQRFSWSWSRGDEPAGSISIATFGNCIELIYTWTPWDDDPQSMRYSVPIERTACNYGGARPWFNCPRCYRRCAVLYGVSSNDGRFGCRHCLRLGYSSETESPLDRLWRKQHKIEARLVDGEIKPKGMRWRTYERLIDRLGELEEKKDVIFLARLGPLLSRSGMRPEELFE